ncbi:hypothetical protein DAPPUDRAFT_236854 [Daphnia pulex]|uniref:Uncharacterized protein n=1 Tax=Daphnia pulex TaxID=6669 RepID=E9G237_DAPPU|nr:hypothetical protein DAPPUDRAFT_236854 [Daphnia pulex]|eukprot:EFX86373.1 hypothetical protein DAPPUDRAFT_236854 [Daphnia pulex]
MPALMLKRISKMTAIVAPPEESHPIGRRAIHMGTNYIVFLLFVPYLFYELSCGDDDIVINHPWMLFRLSAVVTNLSSSTTTLNSSWAYTRPPSRKSPGPYILDDRNEEIRRNLIMIKLDVACEVQKRAGALDADGKINNLVAINW